MLMSGKRNDTRAATRSVGNTSEAAGKHGPTSKIAANHRCNGWHDRESNRHSSGIGAFCLQICARHDRRSATEMVAPRQADEYNPAFCRKTLREFTCPSEPHSTTELSPCARA